MKKQIMVIGGLGNQMFIYALYLSLKQRKMNIILNSSIYNYIYGHNGFELQRVFGINEPHINKRKKLYLYWFLFLSKYKPSIFVFTDNHKLALNVFHSKKRYIWGYWQSEQYFENIKNTIKKSFVFRNIDNLNSCIAKKMQQENAISIHIRLGDYIGHPLFENICTEYYYNKCIEYIIDNVANPVFYVFSNDIDKAKIFMNNKNVKQIFIDNNKQLDSYKDMFLMSMCKHNICANSSFSWWGAWLNNNPNKIVLVPNKWRNSTIDEYDYICPKTWIRIKSQPIQ